MRGIMVLAALLFVQAGFAQQSGVIKVRKAKKVQGLYVLEEGAYYKTKLYVRLFDNNAAVFLRAPLSPEKARDSTAQLLYTYRKSPAVYKVVNDSLYIEGTENKVFFFQAEDGIRGVAVTGVQTCALPI